MTITNGYATLAEFKAWTRVVDTDSPSTDDDAVIERIIESASRYIDREAQQAFYVSSETRKFDVPTGRRLYLDKPLLSVSALTNGDGSTISSTDYIFIPANDKPYYAIDLLGSSSVGWRTTAAGNAQQAISLNGTWGESTDTPADIREACLTIAKAAYNRRFGNNMTSVTTITQGGMVITPEDVPAKALQMIHNHRRIVFG